MINNNDNIVKEYLSLQLIYIQYDNSADKQDIFIFEGTKLLSKKGFEMIKKSYEQSKMIPFLFHDNRNTSFSDVNNNIIPYLLKDLSVNCLCFIEK